MATKEEYTKELRDLIAKWLILQSNTNLWNKEFTTLEKRIATVRDALAEIERSEAVS